MINRIIIVFSFFVISTSCTKSEPTKTVENIFKPEEKPVVDIQNTQKKAEEALKFCKEKNFNQDFCILVDMSLHSGVNRFFVWDFNQNKIVKKFLVGHGCGNSIWSMDFTKNSPKFSNVDGSHLSSLGKYRLGERDNSEWGIGVKYLMHGLEETNSNALKRFIVFHSWEKMAVQEVFPKGSPEGWGCPTVSNDALRELDPLLQNSKKPVLFWMYQ